MNEPGLLKLHWGAAGGPLQQGTRMTDEELFEQMRTGRPAQRQGARAGSAAAQTAAAAAQTAAAAAQTAAVEELAARYYAPLRAYFYRLSFGNLADAEDLVQETFLRLMRYRGPAPAALRAWLFTVGRNLAFDRFRRASYQRERVSFEGDLADDSQRQGSPAAWAADDLRLEEVILARVDGQAVQQALAHLPLAQREVLILRFYHEMKLEEIASITGAPLGTVKSRLLRGLQMLKEGLSQPVEEEKHDTSPSR